MRLLLARRAQEVMEERVALAAWEALAVMEAPAGFRSRVHSALPEVATVVKVAKAATVVVVAEHAVVQASGFTFSAREESTLET